MTDGSWVSEGAEWELMPSEPWSLQGAMVALSTTLGLDQHSLSTLIWLNGPECVTESSKLFRAVYFRLGLF